ncbi:MAG: N-methyl-L-tryptophan oxidase [Phycisphaerae bacterium]
MTQFDVIILGAGAMGSAAAWSLAQRGKRVLVLEKFGPQHDRGSSHGVTRITRKAYFEHPDYVPLVEAANHIWRRLEEGAKTSLLRRTGLLLIGAKEGAILSGARRAQQQFGWRIEEIGGAEIAARFSQFRVPPGSEAIFEPDAGYLRVEESLVAFQEQAKAGGAQFHWQEPVRSWRQRADGVEVVTDVQRYHAAKLVVCAGSWSQALLADLNVELVVLRQPQFWFSIPQGSFDVDRGSPIFGYEISGRFFYGFPCVDGETIKVAEHLRREVVANPEQVNREVSAEDGAEVSAFVKQYLSIEVPAPVRTSVCLYTMTRDEHFIVDRHPEFRCVCFAAGFSGHGFKFAPLIGEMLAGLTMDENVAVPEMWRLNRAGLQKM